MRNGGRFFGSPEYSQKGEMGPKSFNLS